MEINGYRPAGRGPGHSGSDERASDSAEPREQARMVQHLRSPLVGLRLSELQQLSELENFVMLPALQNSIRTRAFH